MITDPVCRFRERQTSNGCSTVPKGRKIDGKEPQQTERLGEKARIDIVTCSIFYNLEFRSVFICVCEIFLVSSFHFCCCLFFFCFNFYFTRFVWAAVVNLLSFVLGTSNKKPTHTHKIENFFCCRNFSSHCLSAVGGLDFLLLRIHLFSLEHIYVGYLSWFFHCTISFVKNACTSFGCIVLHCHMVILWWWSLNEL